mgnify:FL=1
MYGDLHVISAKGAEAALDLRGGHVRRFAVAGDGRTIEPTHTAPWVEDGAIQEDESILPNLRYLSGDFFCAPFADQGPDGAPSHGWPGNARWKVIETVPHPDGGTIARYELTKPVFGARVVKEFVLRDGHPFLYQRHIFYGGEGATSVASHGMTRFPAGGRLAFSPKRFGSTPAKAPEPDPALGRSLLAYPAEFTDLTRVPLADGGFADITTYPFGQKHEDFVMLVEAEGSTLGWALATRPDQRDIYVSLKNPADLPVTLLWFSNGGRDYAPWNGRHVGVQGIEEGRTFGAAGLEASINPNALTEQGVPTALVLDPDGEVEVRNVIGGLPLPAGCTRAAGVSVGADSLTVTDESGASLTVPYDASFLARGR